MSALQAYALGLAFVPAHASGATHFGVQLYLLVYKLLEISSGVCDSGAVGAGVCLPIVSPAACLVLSTQGGWLPEQCTFAASITLPQQSASPPGRA
jgi:hypothetical protein